MTLLLKQLDIHGFKSFATPTTFVFDRGITAIVGPNGSGKSNVAEALRWVLGEQGHANLRSRRTEDVIFAGSDTRAPLGLAEVVLTLDNPDGDLPLPYSEITIARRAYRSGESQYLINGARVRLKDIQQLVAPLGQAYTIIGQGLVDAALSQRPEERRGLFEHAAGISGLRLRANESGRNLAETDANAQRLRDIVGELEPRVRSLERSARMAREYGAVRERLHDLQRRHYAALWRDLTRRVVAARAALRESSSVHEDAERAHESAARRLSTLRADERRAADSERELASAIVESERALADTRHRRAMLDTRDRAAADRLGDIVARIVELVADRQAASDERDQLVEHQAELEREMSRLRGELAAHDARLSVRRRQRAETLEALECVDVRLSEVVRLVARAQGTIDTLRDRRLALEVDEQAIAESIARMSSRRDEVLRDVRAVECDDRHLERGMSAADARRAACQAGLEAARTTITDARRCIERVARDIATLQARHDALARAHAEGQGLHAGVRAIVQAVARGDLELPGMLGTLADIIQVPGEYETALYVALGSHVQDVVVERWTDAESAIAYLTRERAGRATFQPLDTVRPSSRPRLRAQDTGVLGVAVDLIAFPERVAPVIEQVLGRTLVVSDLAASRRLMASNGGWTLITLAGEITRPSGSVTGGSHTTEPGLLARRRELRTIPNEIASLQAEHHNLSRCLEQLAERTEALDLSAAAAAADAADLSIRRSDVRATREQAQRELADIDERLARTIAQRDAHGARMQDIDHEQCSLDARLAELERESRELTTRRERLAGQRDAAVFESDESRAAPLRTALAANEERLRVLSLAAQSAGERVVATSTTIESRESEAARIRDDLAGNGHERATLDTENERTEALLGERRAALEPCQQERAEIVVAVGAAEQALDRATEALRQAERERDRTTLGLARVQDEQVFLVERMRNDLDLHDPSSLDDLPDEDAPDEQEIERLRERLRRMSVVGDDVVELFDAESQRLAFLSDQLRDVDDAAAGLRQVLAQLNTSMAERFDATFRDVRTSFETTFTRLFGGGSAQLVMQQADDGSAGIDIVAQPPGKRLQHLNALSGGERALTAVALLIAIQRVNPSPFCMLDEVDAALDESNVVRFRDEIRDLSGATQFVLITHNRGTIEGADTLYGVTMGDDGISRVVSLRLADAIVAVEAFEAARAAGD